jgi:hypothetical protein
MTTARIVPNLNDRGYRRTRIAAAEKFGDELEVAGGGDWD